jgi:hypothetical protein
METLDDANGFRNSSDPATFDQCDRALKQVVYSFEQLAHVWKVNECLKMFVPPKTDTFP